VNSCYQSCHILCFSTTYIACFIHISFLILARLYQSPLFLLNRCLLSLCPSFVFHILYCIPNFLLLNHLHSLPHSCYIFSVFCLSFLIFCPSFSTHSTFCIHLHLAYSVTEGGLFCILRQYAVNICLICENGQIKYTICWWSFFSSTESTLP